MDLSFRQPLLSQGFLMGLQTHLTSGEGGTRHDTQFTCETTTTAQAAMAGEGNQQIDGLLDPSVAEVMEGPSGHGVTTGTTAAARTGPSKVVAAAAFDPWFREIFNVGDPLGNICGILAWPVHRLFS